MLAHFACAAPPELKHIYPAAAQQGAHTAIAVGKLDQWPVRAWSDVNGSVFTPTPIIGTFDVWIPQDATPGPHVIRLWNEEGASVPRFLIVTRDPELRDVEPNDEFRAPQQIALPAAISGRLDKNGDVDCFGVQLRRGETLVASVESFVLGSTCDPLLRVTDAEGRVLGFNHDGRTLDPLLAWSAPRDGTFIVQLMGFVYPPQSGVQLTGGEGCVYRLHLSTNPTVRLTIPLAARAGQKTPLRLLGWNLPSTQTELDATQLAAGATATKVTSPDADCVEPIAISELAEETEENRPAEPRHVPFAVTGVIGKPREIDQFKFIAVKQHPYEVSLTAARAGSPLDAWMKIENPEGKEIARDDDTGSRDPLIKWTPALDGTFTVTIGDTAHRGGDDFVYRLAITEAAPSIAATIASTAFAIQAGKTAELKISVKRSNGFKTKVELVAKDLPNGITAPAVEVPDKDGEVTLKVNVDGSAAATGQPFRIALREIEGGREQMVRYQFTTTAEDNGVSQPRSDLILDSTDHLWLTVTPPPK